MPRLRLPAVFVALASAVCTTCWIFNGIFRIPDLSVLEASSLISRAPEFNRYSRLLKVERVDHLKHSMNSVSYGRFTFAYLNSAPKAPPIKGWADFRYWDRGWHLNQFDYGCDHSGLDPSMQATDCHFVDVYNFPPK